MTADIRFLWHAMPPRGHVRMVTIIDCNNQQKQVLIEQLIRHAFAAGMDSALKDNQDKDIEKRFSRYYDTVPADTKR